MDDLDDVSIDAADDVATDAAAAAREDGRIEDGEEPRRRRRRGGRGRGRGRGRAEEGQAEVVAETPPRAAAAIGSPAIDEDEIEEVAPPAPRGPRTTPFGSVWDSQLGTPAASSVTRAPLVDEEDFEEPEIPEYLIAEQRRGGNRGAQGGGRGARGGRSAYQSAMERERYGRGGGGSGGINRYPDVSGRSRSSTPPREDRRYGRGDARPTGASAPRGSDEPWSDVPPELEAMLRAQVAQKPAPSRTSAGTSTVAPDVMQSAEATEPVETFASEVGTTPTKPASKARATRKPASGKAATDKPAAKSAAKPRTTRKPAARATAVASETADASGTADGIDIQVADATPATESAPKSRATRKPAVAKAPAPAVGADSTSASAAPTKRRTTRKTAEADPA